MTTRRRLSVLRLASAGVVFGLLFGAITALAGAHVAAAPNAARLAKPFVVGASSGSSHTVQSKQMSGRDNVVAGAGGGGGDSATGICNADLAEHQCEQSNLGMPLGVEMLFQGDQLSGRDSVIGGTAGGGGNNASGVCNAATAEHQCEQANTALVASGDAPNLTQSNQISGRDSAAGGAAGGGGDNASGVCNAATAEHQCEQANTALVASGDAPNLIQSNQISGRDSTAGGAAGGGGNNASGVCNAATAEHQCEQTNLAQVAQSGPTDAAASVSQGNQISGGDSTGAAGGGADNASGVCNAATAEHQCEQTNLAQVAQGGGGDHSADVSQSNQISGQDVCNAATAGHQCEQTNVANISQSGGGNNTATVRQSNGISGQDPCSAATTGPQCDQTNVTEIRQSGSGSNTSTVSQTSETSDGVGTAGG